MADMWGCSMLCAALVNFVNPDLLGSMSTFRRIFGDPITLSRDRGATPEEVANLQKSLTYTDTSVSFALKGLKNNRWLQKEKPY